MKTLSLTGQSETHLCSLADAKIVGFRVHKEVAKPFLELRDMAAQRGYQLTVLSGFRDFKHQLSIWNNKATGKSEVHDSNARPIDITSMTDKELAFAILRWSALPGASRHHWGTDVDVFDEAARPKNYEIALIPEEVNSDGMFGPMHDWLDEMIEAGESCGFFRPYEVDQNGVAPERWHLSCYPIASEFERQLNIDVLERTIIDAEIELKDAVLANLEEIYDRFVTNICRVPT